MSNNKGQDVADTNVAATEEVAALPLRSAPPRSARTRYVQSPFEHYTVSLLNSDPSRHDSYPVCLQQSYINDPELCIESTLTPVLRCCQPRGVSQTMCRCGTIMLTMN